MLRKLFLAHPQSVGEGYFEHQRVAFSFGTSMLSAGLACLVHGVTPWLFETTGSRTIAKLHHRMVEARVSAACHKPAAAAAPAASSTVDA